jgi:alpha 1,2-mannosyltransferase
MKQRWGAAPVNTIGASLFSDKDGVHFFREIGYEHYLFTHCPQGDVWERGRCSWDQERNFGMWQDPVVARLDGFADIYVFRLPWRVVLLAELGAGSQPT